MLARADGPAAAEQLPPLDARDRLVVAGDERDPQVRALAAGYAGLAFVHTPAQAFAAAAVAGFGNGALQPSQSALLATISRREIRHRSTAVSRVAANLGVGLGAVLGGLVAARGLDGFVALFLANAVSYLLDVAILLLAVAEDARPDPLSGGYRLLLRDRAFVRLALTNVAVIAVGWGVFTWVVPPYASAELGLGPELIGLLLLANALTVVLAQIPVARLAESRRRASIMATGALAFVPACMLVLAAGYLGLGRPRRRCSQPSCSSASASASTRRH